MINRCRGLCLVSLVACWSRSLPSCSRRSKRRMVAAFVRIHICFSHFHSPPLCPRNPLSESTVAFQVCIFAFLASVSSSFIQSHGVTETGRQKLVQRIVTSEIQDHLHYSRRQQLLKYTEWNLGNFAHPHLIECFACLLLDCAVNSHFVDSISLQSPFLYNFNSPPARISHFFSRWVYTSAQPIFEKQCHASLVFLFNPMSYLIPILALQTQWGNCQDKSHPLASVIGPRDS